MDEGSDSTWLPLNRISVNGANKAQKSAKVVMELANGSHSNRQSYIQYVTLDGLCTRVRACRGGSLLGEDVMGRYCRVLDRSQAIFATITAIPGKLNHA